MIFSKSIKSQTILMLIVGMCVTGCSRSEKQQKKKVDGPQVLIVIERGDNPAIHLVDESLKVDGPETTTGGTDGIHMAFKTGKVSVSIKDEKAKVTTDFDCIVYIEKLRRTVRVKKEKTFAIK